jgi:quercetin dioxygenase-like cupin family protein
VLVTQVPTDHDDFVKNASSFSWQQFAVNLSAAFDAQFIELGFRQSIERPAGMVVSIMEMNVDAPHDGEMHPDGDEVIYVLEGQFRVRLGVDDPTYLEVAAGHGIVIPKGVWHKIHILAPCRLVTVTPGPGFEYKT